MAPSTNMKPPQAPLLFNATPVSVIDDAKRMIEKLRSVQDRIVETVQPETATFANTLAPLTQAENEKLSTLCLVSFYADVSADEELREASAEAERLIKEFEIESDMREDVFTVIDAVFKKTEDLTPESRRLLKEKHRAFTRNGLALPAENKIRLMEIQKCLSQLKIEFRKNLNEENGGIWLTLQELDGVSSDLLSGMEKGIDENKGKFRLTFNYTELIPIMRHALNSETRKKYYIAFYNKCNQNLPVLKEILVLRDEAARHLGYSNHAKFRLEDRMAKRPDVVNSFLDALRLRLTTGGREDNRKLKQLKKADVESRGEEFDGHLYLWDSAFYGQMMVEKAYSIDMQKVSEYFSLDATLLRMLEAFERLFGLVFVQVAGQHRIELAGVEKSSELTWYEDVRMYTVWDDEGEGGAFCGYLYMDLHPRVGKYGNPSCWSVQPGFIGSDGERRYPSTALVCNFSNPTSTKPSLLKHDEVVMLFHELGHGIHDLVSKTSYARFHGTAVAEDFCETPSVMLEQFCWTPALRDFSQHYSTLSPEYFQTWESEQTDPSIIIKSHPPPQQMSDEMIKDLIRTRNANKSLYYLRQLHVAIYDMTVHQPVSHEAAKLLDTSEVYNSLLTELTAAEGPESQSQSHQWAHGDAIMPHLVGSYDVGLYGYITYVLSCSLATI